MNKRFDSSAQVNVAVIPRRFWYLSRVAAFLFVLLALAVGSLTVMAGGLAQPAAADFSIIKVASHEGVTKGMTVSFAIEVINLSPNSGVVMVRDHLPPEMDFLGVVHQDPGIGNVNPNQMGELTFEANVESGHSLLLEYDVRITDQAICDRDIVNKAELLDPNNEPIGLPAETHLRLLCSDLGDAPASNNHFGFDMEAFPGVKARYPTVYDLPPGTPNGPRHHRADLMHLGDMVSFELEADLGPDLDPTNNILPLFDIPDRDRWDDGLVDLAQLDFAHCQEGELAVEVYLDPALFPNPPPGYINVWFDGNRDGDWADLFDGCGGQNPLAFEHIVIDSPVDTALLGPGLHTVFVLTSGPVYNLQGDSPTWVRVTLSEHPSVKIEEVAGIAYGDGRGPVSNPIEPNEEEHIPGFRLGETEDYFFIPPAVGRVPVDVVKRVDPGSAIFKDILNFTVEVQAGNFNRRIAVIDPIPPGTIYVPGSFNASLPGIFGGYDPPHNAIVWNGDLAAGQILLINFAVRVIECAPDGFTVFNRAEVHERGLKTQVATASASILPCQKPLPPRKFHIRKHAPPIPSRDGTLTFDLEVHNGYTTSLAFELVDPIGPGLRVLTDTLPPGLELVDNNTLIWQADAPPNQALNAAFTVEVTPEACRERIVNQGHWRAENEPEGLWLHGHTNATLTHCSDLGDAPDSDFNHHGATNTAYTNPMTVAGHFPTVWRDTPPGEPSGPFHIDALGLGLGFVATYEEEADIGPDVDGTNNILPGGADVADLDQADDGWLNRDVVLEHCQESTLAVRIFKNDPLVKRVFLNVWFDGNRDGDWDDNRRCSNDDARVAFEWIVQNRFIDLSTVPVGFETVFVVPTVLVQNDHPDQDGWIRFTVSEHPAPMVQVSNPVPFIADGRGPGFPDAYRMGETEDYKVAGRDPTGEPGPIAIDKTASVSAVTVGEVYTYSVYLSSANTGTVPAHTVMTDVLHPLLELVGAPVVSEITPSATPLFAYFNSSVGPSGAVGWEGFLSPGAAIRIDFQVKVRECLPNIARIPNVAVARQIDGNLVSANKDVTIDCTPPNRPQVTLDKHIVTTEGLTDTWHALPGENVTYLLELTSTDLMTHVLHISDDLPLGVVALAAGARSGAAHIINGGHTVVWEGALGPGNRPVRMEILARLTREVECGHELPNRAVWFTNFHEGESNATTIFLTCHDLGDAPDSSNHSGTPMTTFPGSAVDAHFPTVFEEAPPERGPLHRHPRPLHLGRLVSAEFEADRGPDVDGVNNIRPPANQANLDEADDGLKRDELNFAHCRINEFPVWVSIAPDAFPALLDIPGNDGLAYLNVWLDGNRDGDWADAQDCPNQNVPALEHIVIDHPLNVAALGPGFHPIIVHTTGPVFWPAGDETPAWLRVTLSGRPANKTLGGGAYGDGRGYDDPFRLGETEDYLIRGSGQTDPDPRVKKRVFVHPFFEFDANQDRPTRFWQVGWAIEYGNQGSTPVTNVEVVDTYDPGTAIVKDLKLFSHPFISPTISGNSLTYDVGTLGPGEHGNIYIGAVLPFTTPPGTMVINTVTVSGSSDVDPSNNTETVTATIPLLPPFITFPTPGTVCTDTFTIFGRVQQTPDPMAMNIKVYVDGVEKVSDVHPDSEGRWQYKVSGLSDGSHDIYAIAHYNGVDSPASPVVTIIVDTSLFWSPATLRFTNQDGFDIIPRDEEGRTDETGWAVVLRPGQTYTVSVFVCCDDPNVVVELEVPGGEIVSLSDADGDGTFEGTFTTPSDPAVLQSGNLRLCVTCYLVRRCSDGEVLIDPEGTVYDVTKGLETGKLANAIVTCQEAQTDVGTGEVAFGLWPAEDYQQENPQTTGSDGYYSFFTPAGTFRVTVVLTGYQDYTSPDLVVVDDPVEHDVPLTPDVAGTPNYTVTIGPLGFDPPVLEVETGDIIEWVNVDGDVHSTSVTTATLASGARSLTAAESWDSGLLSAGGGSYKRQLTTEGTYTYEDSKNPAYTAQIIVSRERFIYLPLIMR